MIAEFISISKVALDHLCWATLQPQEQGSFQKPSARSTEMDGTFVTAMFLLPEPAGLTKGV